MLTLFLFIKSLTLWRRSQNGFSASFRLKRHKDVQKTKERLPLEFWIFWQKSKKYFFFLQELLKVLFIRNSHSGITKSLFLTLHFFHLCYQPTYELLRQAERPLEGQMNSQCLQDSSVVTQRAGVCQHGTKTGKLQRKINCGMMINLTFTLGSLLFLNNTRSPLTRLTSGKLGKASAKGAALIAPPFPNEPRPLNWSLAGW